jgi:NAD(P)-dependent dehydrogenase (short-subunit alcohol dehydrogenase family)
MKIDLSGKTAIVTGSTGGIGFAIARGLADCGATVVVNGLTQAAVDWAVGTVKASAPAGDVRGVRPEIFDRSVMMSSLMPSEKYSCSGSLDMLVNGTSLELDQIRHWA